MVSWQTLLGFLSIIPGTRGRRNPFITRKHLKAGLIPRVVCDVFGISVSIQNVSSFPEFPCVESLDLGRENCWSCVCTHPGSASASGQETETLREFRAQKSLHGTTARLWDGSGVWMSLWSTKPHPGWPVTQGLRLSGELAVCTHCNLGTLCVQVSLGCAQICNRMSGEGSEAAELCMAFLVENPR